ncbi:hypothetical protein BJ875DRAFT_71703 [Amylocarpus encephaloides]|uniref:SMODS and SLOG-associating 2TM effector domain-containing protein n=1 Tax=Amylocarpus encephaloides TaxID=45428 RepID=A0A9P7YF15_9HELO|nr:hypothetical protein BJ875DRAFT_71703 [Amylocarpus encephaloides]
MAATTRAPPLEPQNNDLNDHNDHNDPNDLKILNDPTDEKGNPLASSESQPESLTHIPDDSLALIITALGGPAPRRRSLRQHIYPPSGLNEGLYKDVLRYRYFSQYKFYSASFLYNFCLIAQLILGAALTSLSASSAAKNGTAITIIAAANTVNAGLVALLHNSGLPSRLRSNMVEYEKVQMWMEEVMRGGVALGVVTAGGAGDTTVTVRDRVVGEASARFLSARMTIEKNRPSAYSATTSLPGIAPTAGGPAVRGMATSGLVA